jgi:hypothetical protein
MALYNVSSRTRWNSLLWHPLVSNSADVSRTETFPTFFRVFFFISLVWRVLQR